MIVSKYCKTIRRHFCSLTNVAWRAHAACTSLWIPQQIVAPISLQRNDGVLFLMQVVLPYPLEALAVRVIPMAWHENIRMRLDLLGCYKELATTTLETTTKKEIITTTTRPAVKYILKTFENVHLISAVARTFLKFVKRLVISFKHCVMEIKKAWFWKHQM